MNVRERYFGFRDALSLFIWPLRNGTAGFESEFASYIGARHAVAASYGRTALYLGLKAIDAQGGEVLVPAFTCTVVRQAIVAAGAVPQFVDVDFETFDMNLDDLRSKLSRNTKAIILTHYFGRVAGNIDEVMRIARERGIALIEDCAHSLGAEFRGKKIGSFGDFSIFSLTKNMINFGGGFFVTNDSKLHVKVRAILEAERHGIRARILDFPYVLAYGMEQMICKLLFDRPGHPKKWTLIHLPRFIVTLRSWFLTLVRWPQRAIIYRKKRKEEATVARTYEKRPDYGQDVSMERIIASLGRSQLRKIDSLSERRKAVYEKLNQCSHVHFISSRDADTKNVYTHIVFRFDNNNVFEIIKQCKNSGLSLIATWPTRQKKWKHLHSENMLRIEKELLVYSINPDLTDQEIEKFKHVMNDIHGADLAMHLVKGTL